jgi:hypothetical protein
VARYFCATQDDGPSLPDPNGVVYNQYHGYYCDNGKVTALGVGYQTGNRLATCPAPVQLGDDCNAVGNRCCEEARTLDGEAKVMAEATRPLIKVYERGVPHPKRVLEKPDEPLPCATVIGDYVAEFSHLDCPVVRARLILLAFDAGKQVVGQAFLIDPDSPRAPIWVPRFKQSEGWVKVNTVVGGLEIVVKGLPPFQLFL